MTLSEKAIFQNFADILLEHTPVGVALYDTQDFRLLAANALFHSLLNPAWQNGRALGHPPADWIVGANVTTIENMFRNAIKYSPAASRIELGLRPLIEGSHEPGEALIWVKDQGIGIAASELPRIFERFHRASNLDRSISGLGIGLYLARELVERHDGRIWVESSEGQGSTFYVRLPLHKRTV